MVRPPARPPPVARPFAPPAPLAPTCRHSPVSALTWYCGRNFHPCAATKAGTVTAEGADVYDLCNGGIAGINYLYKYNVLKICTLTP